MHSSAKTIHMNLAPEHLYVTKDGRLKVAGMNFIQPFQTAEPVSILLETNQKVNEFSMIPNLRFTSPEVTST